MGQSSSIECGVAHYTMVKHRSCLRTHKTCSHFGHQEVEVAETTLAIVDFHGQDIVSLTQKRFGNWNWRNGSIHTTSFKRIINAAAFLRPASKVTQQMAVNINPDPIVAREDQIHRFSL